MQFKSSFFLAAVLLLFMAVFSSPAFAQKMELPDFSVPDEATEKSKREKKGAQTLQDLPADMPVSEFVEGKPQSTRRHIYEKPTLKSLSNLYWALGFADLENNEHIDNYLKLTECKIYRKFIAAEFEWRDIRKATRQFISANRTEFPTRFELVQEIRLFDYDVKRRAFEVAPKYQIQSYRRFEMISSENLFVSACGHKGKEVPGFPKGVILELSRPFSLTYVPVPPDIADAYLSEKSRLFQAYSDNSKSQALMYDLRTAYLVMQVKIFAHRKIQRLSNSFLALQTMAVLEGYEVYGDIGRKQLFYSRSYLKDKSELELSEKLKKEIKILEERVAGNGILID